MLHLTSTLSDRFSFFGEISMSAHDDHYSSEIERSIIKFRAEASSGPRIVVSNNESVELVGVLSGAIALVDHDDIPAGLKILRIDGRRPGDKDYALTRTSAVGAGK